MSAYDRFIENPSYVEPASAWVPRTLVQAPFQTGCSVLAFALFRLALGTPWFRLVDWFVWAPALMLVGLARARNTAGLKPAFWSFWAGVPR